MANPAALHDINLSCLIAKLLIIQVLRNIQILKYRLLSIKAMDDFSTGRRKHGEEQVSWGKLGEPELASGSKAEESQDKYGEERTEMMRRRTKTR